MKPVTKQPNQYTLSHLSLISLLLSFIFALYASVSQAQPSTDINLNLTAEQAEFLLGEPIELTLEITHPTGDTVFVAEVEQWGDLRVREQSNVATLANQDGTETTQQTFVVSRFAVGQFETAPLTITVRAKDGTVQELFTPAIQLTVRETITNPETATLQDIRPQAELPLPFFTPERLMMWGAILAGLAAIFALYYWFFLRQRDKETEKPVFIDPRLPHEVAFDELDRIERLNLPTAGEFKQHYIFLSDCLRDYINRRYQIPALDMTSSEIKIELKQAQLSPELITQFMTMFTEFDMGKFAEFTPTSAEAEQLLDSSRQLVETTKTDLEIVN